MFRGTPSPASDRREPFTPQSSLCCRERPPPSAWPDYRRHLGEVIHVEDEIAFIVLKSDLAFPLEDARQGQQPPAGSAARLDGDAKLLEAVGVQVATPHHDS